MVDIDAQPYDCEACVLCPGCGRHWRGEPGWHLIDVGEKLPQPNCPGCSPAEH